MIICLAETPEDHLKWQGYCQSKMRHLVTRLQYIRQINTVHINPVIFSSKAPEYEDKIHSSWFVGLDLKEFVDITDCVAIFLETGESV